MAAKIPTQKTSLGARFILSGLGVVLAALGITFSFLLWHSRQLGQETRHWKEIPCEIISSEVHEERPTPNSPVHYRAQVLYRYELDGSVHHSSLIRRGEGPSSDRDKAQARCDQFKIGLKTVCYVNPDDPSMSVLVHTSLAAPYSMWFTLLFAIAGFGMIWTAWRRK